MATLLLTAVLARLQIILAVATIMCYVNISTINLMIVCRFFASTSVAILPALAIHAALILPSFLPTSSELLSLKFSNKVPFGGE